MEEKIVDAQGRLYLGKWFAKKKVYVVNLGDVIVITPYSKVAELLKDVTSMDDFLKLEGVTKEEIRQAFREAIWRKLSSIQAS